MKHVIVGFVFLFCLKANAQLSKTNWREVSMNELLQQSNAFEKHYRPSTFKVFSLDEQALQNTLLTAPNEQKSNAGVVIKMPTAEGMIEQFKIVEAPVMQNGLAAEYPGIKTYAGQGIEDPTATIRFAVTPEGFSGIILSAKRKTIYINAVDKQKNLYIVFDRDAVVDSSTVFDCNIDAAIHNSIQGRVNTAAKNVTDGKQRIYRLALATTAEFSAKTYDSTVTTTAAKKAKVLATLVIDVLRANALFERDLGLRVILVDNEDKIIFLDPDTDPFTTQSKYPAQLQQALDSLIRDKNYDVGHLLAGVKNKRDNNGNANCIGCVCVTGEKGSGFTAHTDVIGDPLVVDYFTHELGHQFGANHTFTFSIEPKNPAQMEPGSGSTIMGYAGITGSTDVQNHSDDYFHAISIEQITDNIQNDTLGGACAATIKITNRVPLIKPIKNYTIPAQTPFVLSGSASDADGDNLTYTWEQMDLYKTNSSTIPSADSKKGPLFRSVKYSTDSSRYFPNLSTILNGKLSNKWEALPAVTRTMNFRLTVRDNHPAIGTNNSRDVLLKVDSASGPFKITSFNTDTIFKGGDTKTITWDVANTNVSPINCSKVDLLLSLDGGNTFPYTLAASTANDGAEQVQIPNIASKKARIKIAAVDNIFFDINDVNITISAVLPVTWITFTATPAKTAVQLNWSTSNEVNNKTFTIQRSFNGINFTNIGVVNAGTAPRSLQYYNFIDASPLSGINYYRLQQTDADGRFSFSKIIAVTMQKDAALFAVYPNPASSQASIKLYNNIASCVITITNANGKIVYTNSLHNVVNNTSVKLPLQHFSKGVYLVKIIMDGDTKTEKLLVQ